MDESQPTNRIKEWITAEEWGLLDIVRPQECEQYSGHGLSELPVFKYDALEPNQIRLLRLHPGSKSDHMRCSLRTVNISDQLDYEAVSYCWGSSPSDQPCSIECNGSRIAATESLVDALWHFRFRDDNRILWVDAVCIDQGNLEERAQQVRVMDRIYSQAVRVLAFAGNERVFDETALNIISKMERILQDQNPDLGDDWIAIMERYARLGYIGSPSPDASLRLSKLDVSRFVMKTFRTRDVLHLCCLLSCRPYFSRCWVVQEIVLAKTVTIFFGPRRLPWDSFAASVIMLARIFSINGEFSLIYTSIGCGVMQKTRLVYRFDSEAYRNRATLFWQIINAFPLRAAVPLDRVYAFLGLIAPSERKDIPVEYSIPPARLFHHVIVLFLRSAASSGLHPLHKILSYLNHTALHSSGQLPSWVPDLAAFDMEEERRQTDREGWSAGGTCPNVKLSSAGLSPSDPRELRLRGVFVGRILEICHEFIPIPTDRKDLQFMHPEIAGRWLILRTLDTSDIRRLTDEGSNLRRKWKNEEAEEVVMRETTERLAAMVRRARVGWQFCRRFEGEPGIKCGATGAAMEAAWDVLCASDFAKWGDLTFVQELMASSPDLGMAKNWKGGHPFVRGLNAQQCRDLDEIMWTMGTEGWSGRWSDCSLAVADGGRLLRVPTRAEVGDSIYIFGGAATGHVLRRVAGDDERWSIIGAAFIQGAMMGELMPDEPLNEDHTIRIV